MNAKDQAKLLEARYTIIRRDDQPAIRIKYKDYNCREWRTLKKYETKAERDREADAMLESSFFIED